MIFVFSVANSVHAQTTISTGIGVYPSGVAYDSNTHNLYVINPYAGTISVISDSNNQITSVIHNVVGAVAGAGTLVYDSNDHEIICSSGAVISESSNSVTANLNVGTTPAGIAYDSNNGDIYVANANDPGTVTVTPVSSGTPSTSSSTSSASTSSSPAVPEFSNVALVLVTTAMLIVTGCAVAVSRKKSKITS